MDRQPHDYTSAMAFTQQQQQQAGNIQQPQQQQQFGYHPQHQQFPPSVHPPPFLPHPHPSLQQYPFPRHLPQPPPQPYPHPPPHPHLLHLQQQQQPPPFTTHLPPLLAPSPFRGFYDSTPPPPAPPPSDPELQKRIDKLIEYSAKNGPEFEAMIREKQQDNPAYSFLFGGEGYNYYRYKLYISIRQQGGPFNPIMMHPPPNPMMGSTQMVPPQMHQPPFPPYYEQQQQSQAYLGHDSASNKPFKGLSGTLPSDVAMELNNVLNSLTGTKESIKGAKIWFMQRSAFAPALAEALRDRVFGLDDSERQLHIIYLANDILFDSLQRRINSHELDNEALAFRPVLGSMLARIYHNPQNKEENQSRLQKILQFWASKEVFDNETIYGLESEMLGRVPPNSFSGPSKDLSSTMADPTAVAGQTTHHNIPQWQPDKQSSVMGLVNQDQSTMQPSQQFHPNSAPNTPFMGPMPTMATSVQPMNQQPHMLPAPNVNITEKLPPYPLFPPGLIPGMVRKMQIGSGVPYSPMSPLDIPTVIPPSNVSPSEILDRVSKFFKEIGEVNPSEGPLRSSNSKDDDDYDDYEREQPVRKGGACIPPPPNLQVDPETGTYSDGSVDRKPGSSGPGRLGLGATTDPNEASQYDDVYSSYRKQRSTTYHSSMSARAATR